MTILAALHTTAYIIAAPDSPAIAPEGANQFLKMLGYVKWGGGLACVIGLIIAGAGMAVSHRRGSAGEHGSAIGFVFTGSILCGIAATLVTALGA